MQTGSCRIVALVFGALALAAIAVPAAASGTSTRVVRCGEEDCLRISGERENASQAIRVNGHAVAAEGDHDWRVTLPVATVREWSEPHAREIEVALADPQTQQERKAAVKLPIGLLGGVELSSLVVTVN